MKRKRKGKKGGKYLEYDVRLISPRNVVDWEATEDKSTLKMPLTGSLDLDCLHSAFSLKIRQVLISASAIANHDVMLEGIGTRQEKTFSSRACALVYRAPLACLGFACSNFARKNKRLLAV